LYRDAPAMEDKSSSMGTPVCVQFLDGVSNVPWRTEIRQPDFDGDIVPILRGPAMQPRLLLRVGAQVRVKVMRPWLRSVKLPVFSAHHDKRGKSD